MKMEYIAILDYEHLDNGLFLANLAKAVSRQKNKGLIIHGDSAYTDRLIQTGMMREDAQIRAAKDLNHRLVALFADHGVSSIGLNGYQRSMISTNGNNIEIDKALIDSLPSSSLLVLSNIAQITTSEDYSSLPLAILGNSLQNEFKLDELIVFSTNEQNEIIKSEMPKELSWDSIDAAFQENYLPEEFHHRKELSLRLLSPNEFGNYPEIHDSTLIY